MEKTDFRKALDSYAARQGRFDVVDVPEMSYLMIDGHGDPNTSSSFAGAIETLYPVAYALKFASKREHGRDYVVPPLEGLWWANDLTAFTTRRDKTQWDWTLMLMVPVWIERAMIDAAIEHTRAKRQPARLDDLRYETLVEGRCVQTLHVGSFDDEAAVLERLHTEIVPGLGYRMTGTHHEIYLSDVRRVAPGKRRTILRQPVTTAPS